MFLRHQVKQRLIFLSKSLKSFHYFLQKKVLEAQTMNTDMPEEKVKYSKLLQEEKETSLQNEAKVGNRLIFLASCFNSNCCGFMICNGFFTRLRNWKRQMRNCNSAEKRSRKLLLRYVLQNLLHFGKFYQKGHFRLSSQLYLNFYRLLSSLMRLRFGKMPETFSTNVLEKRMQH